MLPENEANLQKAESSYAEGKIFEKGLSRILDFFSKISLLTSACHQSG
jgi:hypothetical protein